MSFGAMLGMNFINKGIDQFTFGVGQEYNRYAREKSRKWQQFDLMNQLGYRIKDGLKYGIHPLAAIGANVSPGSPISVGGVSPPSGGGQPYTGPVSKSQERILEATARKEEAEAGIQEKILEKMGQGKYEVPPGSGLAPEGQPDGNIYPANLDNQGAVENIEKYGVTSDGYIYLAPTQNWQEAFGEEGTAFNRLLYNARAFTKPYKIKKLKENWNSNDPEIRTTKFYFLQTRPVSRDPNEIILHDGTGWRAYPKSVYGNRYLFVDGAIGQHGEKTGAPLMRPRYKKRRVNYGKKFNRTGSGL